MRPSELPIRTKIAMLVAFFATMGVIYWITSQAVRHWLPVWLTDIMLVVILAAAVAKLGYDRLARRRNRLPSSIE